MASVTATLSPGASAALSPAPHATQHITSTAANIRARDAALAAAAIITTMYERANNLTREMAQPANRVVDGAAASERAKEVSLFLLRYSALADIRLCACARFYLLLISRPPEPYTTKAPFCSLLIGGAASVVATVVASSPTAAALGGGGFATPSSEVGGVDCDGWRDTAGVSTAVKKASSLLRCVSVEAAESSMRS